MRILYLQSPPSEKGTPLAGLAEACLSLTPKVAVHLPREVYLDISVTESFFGGEARTLFTAGKILGTFAPESRMVLTDRPEWARALAVLPKVLLPVGKSQNYLFGLPIDRLTECGDPLELDGEGPGAAKSKDSRHLIAFMKRVGMRTIADFARLTPAAVHRRFGKQGRVFLDWVTGTRDLVLPPFVPTDKISESLDTEDVTSLEGLLFYLRQTLVRIEARLRGRARMARQLKLGFALESRRVVTKTLDLSQPLQESQAMLRLLREFLQECEWDSPLKNLEIEVSDSMPFTPGQLSLWDRTENQFTDLAQYVGRLRARFGDSSVGVAGLKESYLPERSWNNIWPPASPPKATRPPPISRRRAKEVEWERPGKIAERRLTALFPERPLFLFSPPKPCSPPKQWRLTPSEDLAVEWWQPGGSRRYFIAENPQGERLWVFWDPHQKEWYLHGSFD